MFHPQGPTVWELLVQALSSTEQGYDLLAPKFDSTPFRTPEAILGPAMAQLGGPSEHCHGAGYVLWHGGSPPPPPAFVSRPGGRH